MRRMLAVALVVVVGFFMLSVLSVIAQEPCTADFNCDQNVDATDVDTFLSMFGRNPFNDPCPLCQDSLCPCSSTVPKTGQTTTRATGDDGDLEKGLTWPNPRFTDNGDGTVTDNLTELIWLKDANCFGQRTWNNALSDSNGLASGSCGLTDGSSAGDWRLPNSNELASLVHKGHYDPAVPDTLGTGRCSQGDPFNNVQLHTYWSSTPGAGSSESAWFVYMGNGYVYYDLRTGFRYVWPVRGGH